MAKARMVWQGLDELKATLQALPDTLTVEAGKLSETHANAAAFEIRSGYPVMTGGLRNATKVAVITKGPHRTGRRVVNLHPLAHFFETGTKVRHYVTVNGVKHLTGAIKARHVFVPRIIRHRRRFIDALKAALLRHGASRVSD